MKRISVLWILLLAVAVLLGGCTSGGGSGSPEQTAASGSEAVSVTSVESSEMRLVRTEGTVTLTEEDATPIPVRQDMRLFSGNVISTEEASRAGISLDEAKAVTLGALSQADIYQDGRKLVMGLQRGELYFSVSKPLDEDESFEINTSTMTMGIRGTAGYVSAEDDSRFSVILTCGKAELSASEEFSASLLPGIVYTVEVAGDEVHMESAKLTVETIPELLAEELARDAYALERTIAEADLDEDALRARVFGRNEGENPPAPVKRTYEAQDEAGRPIHIEERSVSLEDGTESLRRITYTADSPEVLVECRHSGRIVRRSDGEVLGKVSYDVNFTYTMSDPDHAVVIQNIRVLDDTFPGGQGTYTSDLEIVIRELSLGTDASQQAETEQPAEPITTSLVFEDAYVVQR